MRSRGLTSWTDTACLALSHPPRSRGAGHRAGVPVEPSARTSVAPERGRLGRPRRRVAGQASAHIRSTSSPGGPGTQLGPRSEAVATARLVPLHKRSACDLRVGWKRLCFSRSRGCFPLSWTDRQRARTWSPCTTCTCPLGCRRTAGRSHGPLGLALAHGPPPVTDLGDRPSQATHSRRCLVLSPRKVCVGTELFLKR